MRFRRFQLPPQRRRHSGRCHCLDTRNPVLRTAVSYKCSRRPILPEAGATRTARRGQQDHPREHSRRPPGGRCDCGSHAAPTRSSGSIHAARPEAGATAPGGVSGLVGASCVAVGAAGGPPRKPRPRPIPPPEPKDGLTAPTALPRRPIEPREKRPPPAVHRSRRKRHSAAPSACDYQTFTGRTTAIMILCCSPQAGSAAAARAHHTASKDSTASRASDSIRA